MTGHVRPTAVGRLRRIVASASMLAVLAPAAAQAAARQDPPPDPFAPAYSLDLQGSSSGYRWSGRETVAFTNPGPDPISEIHLKLWGNGTASGRCPKTRAVRVRDVAGATARALGVGCTDLPLALDTPVAAGERREISLTVDISVPKRVDRFGRYRGVALLSNALPILAARTQGAWRRDRYFPSGEAFVSEPATWTVRLTPPKGLQVAASGQLGADGAHTATDSRDFAFVAGKLREHEQTVGGVKIRTVAPKSEPRDRWQRAQRFAREEMTDLVRLLGPFPFAEVDVVMVPVGMEHAGLVMTPHLRFVVAHELAHEWFYASVGNDQARSPWLDEGFATYGEEWVTGYRGRYCGNLPRGTRRREITKGTAYWQSSRRVMRRYGNTIYFAGSCLLHELRGALGTTAFHTALRDYVAAKRFGWSTAADFKAAMEAAAGEPARLAAIWRRYGL